MEVAGMSRARNIRLIITSLVGSLVFSLLAVATALAGDGGGPYPH